MFFVNMSRKIRFHYNLARETVTEHEGVCTFMVISLWILLRMRNFSHKICRERQSTFCFPITFFENRAVYEIIRENEVVPDGPRTTI